MVRATKGPQHHPSGLKDISIDLMGSERNTRVKKEARIFVPTIMLIVGRPAIMDAI
jgi:hypothetical protein